MVVYEGPSVLNGEPIVGIITGLTAPSQNRKTGPMAQLWILDASEEPHEAVRTGQDASVCGDCPARGKWCYVTTFQGPLSIYRTWKRGGYEECYSSARLRGKALRLGAYGDPAALPIETIRRLARDCDRFTGYTHQWKRCSSELRQYCMASVDTVSDQEQASRSGWRTFRVSADGGKLRGESVCPASTESGIDITCFECGACDGRHRERVKGHIVIKAHGAKTKRFLEEFA